MKKYITFSIISVLVFLIGYVLLKQYKIKPDEIFVELEAVVLEDDTFQLFYLAEGMSNFTEEQSIKVEVRGTNDRQKIKFSIPINIPIVKFRIDIGENSSQEPIKLNYVKISSVNRAYQYDVREDFTANSFIQADSKQIKAQIVDHQYDPFFESNFDVSKIVKILRKTDSTLSNTSIFFLSLIFSISVFIALYYKETRIKFSDSYSLILIFFIILSAPMFVRVFNINIRTTATEKRELTPKPTFKIGRDYPQLFEQYYNDNFGLRTLFVNLNSKIKVDLFRASPNPSAALFGKDGFMFFNLKSNAIFRSYTNTNLVSQQALENAYQKQVEIRNTLTSKDIQYVIGFFPNKHTIYPEMMPFSMNMQIESQNSFADQATTYFKSKKFTLVDVREDLLTEKKERQLYHKLDTHWNSYGAYIGYVSLCHQTYDLLGLTPYDISCFDISYSEERSGDLTDLIGRDKIDSYFDSVPTFSLKDSGIGFEILDNNKEYPDRTVITLNENCNNEKTVLVFRDSFSVGLVKFLSLHYHKVIYIWDSTYPTLDMEMIEKTNPDVVMLLGVERSLNHLLLCY